MSLILNLPKNIEDAPLDPPPLPPGDYRGTVTKITPSEPDAKDKSITVQFRIQSTVNGETVVAAPDGSQVNVAGKIISRGFFYEDDFGLTMLRRFLKAAGLSDKGNQMDTNLWLNAQVSFSVKHKLVDGNIYANIGDFIGWKTN